MGLVPVESSSVIGACGDTIPASDAPIVIDYDDTIRLFPRCFCGAGFYTRGIITMKTLNPHIEMILHRHFVKVFSVSHLRAHFAVLHFEYSDVLNI
jgi:hypothetical protein